MFYQLLFLSQVKRTAIITYNHDICELASRVPNNFFDDGRAFMPAQEKKALGSSKIRKYQQNLKTLLNNSLVPSLSAKMIFFVNSSKKLLKSRN